jgi:hypothetical protein
MWQGFLRGGGKQIRKGLDNSDAFIGQQPWSTTLAEVALLATSLSDPLIWFSIPHTDFQPGLVNTQSLQRDVQIKIKKPDSSNPLCKTQIDWTDFENSAVPDW